MKKIIALITGAALLVVANAAYFLTSADPAELTLPTKKMVAQDFGWLPDGAITYEIPGGADAGDVTASYASNKMTVAFNKAYPQDTWSWTKVMLNSFRKSDWTGADYLCIDLDLKNQSRWELGYFLTDSRDGTFQFDFGGNDFYIKHGSTISKKTGNSFQKEDYAQNITVILPISGFKYAWGGSGLDAASTILLDGIKRLDFNITLEQIASGNSFDISNITVMGDNLVPDLSSKTVVVQDFESVTAGKITYEADAGKTDHLTAVVADNKMTVTANTGYSTGDWHKIDLAEFKIPDWTGAEYIAIDFDLKEQESINFGYTLIDAQDNGYSFDFTQYYYIKYGSTMEKKKGNSFSKWDYDSVFTIILPVSGFVKSWGSGTDPITLSEVKRFDFSLTFQNNTVGRTLDISNMKIYLPDDFTLPENYKMVQDFDPALAAGDVTLASWNDPETKPTIATSDKKMTVDFSAFSALGWASCEVQLNALKEKDWTGAEYIAFDVDFQTVNSFQMDCYLSDEAGSRHDFDYTTPFFVKYGDNLVDGVPGNTLRKSDYAPKITVILPKTGFKRASWVTTDLVINKMNQITFSVGLGPQSDSAFSVTNVKILGATLPAPEPETPTITLPAKSLTVQDFNSVIASKISYDCDGADSGILAATVLNDEMTVQLTKNAADSVGKYGTVKLSDLLVTDWTGAEYLAIEYDINTFEQISFTPAFIDGDGVLYSFSTSTNAFYVKNNTTGAIVEQQGNGDLKESVYGKSVTVYLPMSGFATPAWYNPKNAQINFEGIKEVQFTASFSTQLNAQSYKIKNVEVLGDALTDPVGPGPDPVITLPAKSLIVQDFSKSIPASKLVCAEQNGADFAAVVNTTNKDMTVNVTNTTNAGYARAEIQLSQLMYTDWTKAEYVSFDLDLKSTLGFELGCYIIDTNGVRHDYNFSSLVKSYVTHSGKTVENKDGSKFYSDVYASQMTIVLPISEFALSPWGNSGTLDLASMAEIRFYVDKLSDASFKFSDIKILGDALPDAPVAPPAFQLPAESLVVQAFKAIAPTAISYDPSASGINTASVANDKMTIKAQQSYPTGDWTYDTIILSGITKRNWTGAQYLAWDLDFGTRDTLSQFIKITDADSALYEYDFGNTPYYVGYDDAGEAVIVEHPKGTALSKADYGQKITVYLPVSAFKLSSVSQVASSSLSLNGMKEIHFGISFNEMTQGEAHSITNLTIYGTGLDTGGSGSVDDSFEMPKHKFAAQDFKGEIDPKRIIVSPSASTADVKIQNGLEVKVKDVSQGFVTISVDELLQTNWYGAQYLGVTLDGQGKTTFQLAVKDKDEARYDGFLSVVYVLNSSGGATPVYANELGFCEIDHARFGNTVTVLVSFSDFALVASTSSTPNKPMNREDMFGIDFIMLTDSSMINKTVTIKNYIIYGNYLSALEDGYEDGYDDDGSIDDDYNNDNENGNGAGGEGVPITGGSVAGSAIALLSFSAASVLMTRKKKRK